MAWAFLGLGSNLGDREGNLKRALEMLAEKARVIKASSVYDTEPVGFTDQPRFLNMACEVETELDAWELLRWVKDIEKRMGRRPDFRNAPRVVDIDILLYGEDVIESGDLTVPHLRMTERAFVLVPLAEIAPEAVHPVCGRTVREMLEVAETRGVREISNGSRGMYEISVETHFDSAHCLRGYAGKCEALHGHRFKLVVTLRAAKLNETGLAYDFTDLKRDLEPIIAKLDHQNLNEVPPFDKINPSSENLARTIYEWLAPKYTGDARLESVEIWESPTSRAVYRA